MPDLHAWITERVDTAEQRTSRWHDAECDSHATSLSDAMVLRTATLCDCDGPAIVARRCAADRRILARHRLDPTVYFEPACEGCRTCGDPEMPWVDDLNECPELLDLAHAHGITPEILAGLDRPDPPSRPVRPTAQARYMWPLVPTVVPAAFRGPMYGHGEQGDGGAS